MVPDGDSYAALMRMLQQPLMMDVRAEAHWRALCVRVRWPPPRSLTAYVHIHACVCTAFAAPPLQIHQGRAILNRMEQDDRVKPNAGGCPRRSARIASATSPPSRSIPSDESVSRPSHAVCLCLQPCTRT